VSPPDTNDGFDRYELKLHKQVAPLLKEWCDLLLFCNYRVAVVEGEDGRMKGRGGKERFMHAQRSAAWDAKNRYGLPEAMPMGIGPLSQILSDCPGLFDRIAEYVRNATTVRALGTTSDKVDGYASTGELSEEQAEALRHLIAERRGAIQPQEVADVVA
jgi:hypothetical protein